MPLPDGVPLPQRYWAILTIALGLTLAVLDGAIANVALPTIARDVHTSPSASIWVVNAYQLAVTISLLPLASLGEIYGYRRIYQGGLVVFTIASLLCALSASLPTLTLARIIQGFGAAGIMSVNGALVRFIYPRRWIGRGVGLNATIGSIASALGPTVAAGILSVGNWPWLFAVNMPLGMLAVPIALRHLPVDAHLRRQVRHRQRGAERVHLRPADHRHRRAGPRRGHRQCRRRVVHRGRPGLRAGGAADGAPAPLLPVDLLRIPLFALSVATSVCAFVAQSMALVSLPFLFENTLGFDAVATGLLMTPWPLTVAVIAPISGRLADRYPVGILSGCGLTVMAGGPAVAGLLPAHPAPIDIVWRMTICGLGFGFFNTPNNRAIITSAPPVRTGGASGMQATARLLGQTMGAALVALVFGVFPVTGTTASMLFAAVASVAAAA